MSAAAVAARVRVALVGAVGMAAALWGTAVALLAGRLDPRVGMVCGMAVAAAVLWRGRHAWSIPRVALWVEERHPTLQYAFVTAVERGRDLPVAVGPVLGRALARAIGPALAAALFAVLFAVLLPQGPHRRGVESTALSVASRLTPLAVRITAPTYANVPVRTLTDPTTIPALVGSRIAIAGPHAWDTAFVMPASPTVERLIDRRFTRTIVLQPIADAPPTVVLTAPARDSVIKAPVRGTLNLNADASDDIGLANGYFEYLITSGQEESGGVKAREARTGQVAFDDAKHGAFRVRLRLDSLGVVGGDLLSVRAVVLDGNTVSGPGKGVSETRSIRILSQQAYDSLALEAAPPEGVDTADQVDVGNRLYLRGAPPLIVVDVNGVRLHGTGTPEVVRRTAGPALTTLWGRFARAVDLLHGASSAGMDSLAMIRADATDPALASALDDALAALHADRDPRSALLRARQAIIGSPTASGALSAW
jgi:hypothetical protein